jgi:hypothetical protein
MAMKKILLFPYCSLLLNMRIVHNSLMLMVIKLCSVIIHSEIDFVNGTVIPFSYNTRLVLIVFVAQAGTVSFLSLY